MTPYRVVCGASSVATLFSHFSLCSLTGRRSRTRLVSELYVCVCVCVCLLSPLCVASIKDWLGNKRSVKFGLFLASFVTWFKVK